MEKTFEERYQEHMDGTAFHPDIQEIILDRHKRWEEYLPEWPRGSLWFES